MEEFFPMTNQKVEKVDLTKSKEVSEPTISAVELAELRKAAAKVEELEISNKEAIEKAAELEKFNNEAQAKLKEIEVEKAAKAKEDMTDLVKGFTFIGEDSQEDVVASLLKSKDTVLLATLQKAQEAIDEFAVAEHGSDATGEDIEKSAAQKNVDAFDQAAADIMKQRKENKGAK
jgi:hypothetical protein